VSQQWNKYCKGADEGKGKHDLNKEGKGKKKWCGSYVMISTFLLMYAKTSNRIY
jgi:hypothetical protein